MKKSRGFSLIEVTVSLALSGIVAIGMGFVMTKAAALHEQADYQSIVDNTYYIGAQIARSSAHLKQEAARGGVHVEECLSGLRTDCAALANVDHPLVPPDAPELNGYFGPRNCTGGPSSDCTIRRYVDYRWVCSAIRCTGMNVRVRVIPYEPDLTTPSRKARARDGTFAIMNRSVGDRSQIRFHCGSQAIFGVNYSNLTDDCTQYEPGDSCVLPMKTYGTGQTVSQNCQPAQTKDCGEGFSSLALFESSNECAPAYVPPVVVAVPSATPAATPGPTPAPTPAGTPAPAQLWTSNGAHCSTTCTGFGCDAVQSWSCVGPACPAPIKSCYCVANRFTRQCETPGQTSTTEPTCVPGYAWYAMVGCR